MARDSLNEIALRRHTDKSSAGHNYCPIYERLFAHLRDKPVALLELGVFEGASLRTWAEYFTHPDTRIVGIDIDLGVGNHAAQPLWGRYYGSYQPLRQCYGPPPPGIATYLGDQAAVPAGLTGWHPDIVIDDASHVSSKTIASFKTWFPLLRPCGLYAVEDVNTSYDVRWGADESSADPDRPPRPGGQTAMQFLRRLADEVQAQIPQSEHVDLIRLAPEYHLGFDIDRLCFYPNMVVAHKRDTGI